MQIILGILVLLAAFLAYVSTRNGKFRYERNGLILAPADQVFNFVSNFKNGALWNPFAKKDPNMKTKFSGIDGQVGSTLDFEGNRDAGAGKLELLKLTPHQIVEVRLTMIRPFRAVNQIVYQLTPEGAGTRFSWAMTGDGGFMGKLVNVFMDCEKMVAPDFEVGISNLKSVLEAMNR